ncbi:hypothetical protein UFOVP276_76 [uncultured Caudovirales phage]|uniref:Portal protein n=1 Tax=uncultured Caudovirales phage TaxID=2100421 RepID=A0A6J5LJ77_9CAUD|nr:hypothetical protein UFOVP127_213 [uncultured Caudovirales phage]CAB4135113.1 hypothetical protein UFOVP276_76 [uncultured Caudovirales phage]
MSVGLGGADSSALRFSRSRGRSGGSSDYGLQYPSPFFDIGQTYLPATIKQMFRWCRYYFLVNPLINAVVAKMADYPITDIILETDKPDLKDKWYTFLNSQLRYRPFQIELGLDFYAYGNALVSIFYPFIKMLRCKRCGHEKPAADATYRFQNFEFHWECSKCNHADIATVRDHYIKAPKGIRLLRWNPEDIDIRYNDITGDTEYYYTIPVQIKNDIIMGKKSTVETMPQLFIDALRLRKAVVFSRDNIYHFKRPTLAGKDRGWGTPLILPVLKDTFYLQILRKAQEAIALEHIVPLRVLFPQAGSASSDPYSSVNLMDWHDQIAGELRRWRSDNSYIPILPLPIGQQTIGGDGRALLLTQEIRVWSEHIIAGMGVPTELIFGGLSYSGSNVSLRMLENMFLGYLSDQLALLNWVIERTASYLGWAKVGARFKPFKMADDLQRKAYLFQLNQAGKISDESLCSDADYDSSKEDKIMENEATRRIGAMKKQRLLQAEMEGEAAMVQQKWQTKAQNKALAEQTAIQGEAAKDQMAFQSQMQNGMMQDQMAAQTGQEPPPKSPDMAPAPRDPSLLSVPKGITSPLTLHSVQQHPSSTSNTDIAGGQNVDLLFMARKLADKFSRLNPGEKPVMLGRLKELNPTLYSTVTGLMMSGGNGPTAAAQASARPLPLQRAPRRGPEAAQV